MVSTIITTTMNTRRRRRSTSISTSISTSMTTRRKRRSLSLSPTAQPVGGPFTPPPYQTDAKDPGMERALVGLRDQNQDATGVQNLDKIPSCSSVGHRRDHTQTEGKK
uniref:Uncharacterized protein n=1 Tax=Micrurus surinamensis TaxID=129470 RepID=A0A2D4P858_MICSU